jgi:hypothetical protein
MATITSHSEALLYRRIEISPRLPAFSIEWRVRILAATY